MNLTKHELNDRRSRFVALLNEKNPSWDSVIIISKINQYYFTGTMQDALLIIKRNGDAFYFVRKSYERAKDESPLLEIIFPINSYRDAAAVIGDELGNCCFEEETVPFAALSRLQKYFKTTSLIGIDGQIRILRAVKSDYEIDCMTRSGKLHAKLMNEVIPEILTEGMSEAEFAALVYYHMVKLGHHGVSRFFSFQTEVQAGQFAFSENTLYPTNFNGAAGSRCYSAAAPVLGSPSRRLKKGDLVFADVSFGVDGYHTDKTQLYIFGAALDTELKRAHDFCLKIMNELTSSLRAGAIPSKVYSDTMNSLSENEKINFMGYKTSAVKFLGHGVGLNVDEYPVIAKGFDDPLKENMTLAVEPKKAVENLSLVGVEETFLVTPLGLKPLTGGAREIIRVK